MDLAYLIIGIFSGATTMWVYHKIQMDKLKDDIAEEKRSREFWQQTAVRWSKEAKREEAKREEAKKSERYQTIYSLN